MQDPRRSGEHSSRAVEDLSKPKHESVVGNVALDKDFLPLPRAHTILYNVSCQTVSLIWRIDTCLAIGVLHTEKSLPPHDEPVTLQTQPREGPRELVADLDQVVGQRLDRLGGVSSLDTLAIVANENSLRGLDCENTGAALYPDIHGQLTVQRNSIMVGIVTGMPRDRGLKTYQAAVHTPVLGPEDDVSLTADVSTLGERLVDGTSSAGDDVGDVLHLFGLKL